MSVQQDEMFAQGASPRQRVNRTGTAGEMASREHASGVFSHRVRQVADALAEAGPVGMTSKEMRAHLGGEASGNHHGKVSGALSSMHADGLIVSLHSRRDGAYVYVLPEHAAGRPERTYGGRKQADGDGQDTTESASRPHLTEAEKGLVAKIEEALPGIKSRHEPAVRLTVESVDVLLRALRRLDA